MLKCSTTLSVLEKHNENQYLYRGKEEEEKGCKTEESDFDISSSVRTDGCNVKSKHFLGNVVDLSIIFLKSIFFDSTAAADISCVTTVKILF